MSYDCMRRSPYGIGTPAVHPPVLPHKPNWMQRLLHLRNITFPTYRELHMMSYIKDSNSAQIQPRGGSYETKLEADWQGGRRSDDVTPLHGLSTGLRFPWPVGTDFGPPSDQERKRDFVPRYLKGRSPQAAAPMYRPVAAPYQGLHSSTPGYAWDPSSAGGSSGREDLVPIGGRQQMFHYAKPKDVGPTQPSNIGMGYGLDYGPTPWRVPMMRKSGLSLMAGSMQFATQQQWSGVASVAGPSGSVLAAPPVWGDITRGSRGVSGILQRVQGPGRSNVPAVFTPNEVR